MDTDVYSDRPTKEDVFDTVANLVERLTVNDKGKNSNDDGDHHQDYDHHGDEGVENDQDDEEDEFKIVDEIESLCMKCHENVLHFQS